MFIVYSFIEKQTPLLLNSYNFFSTMKFSIHKTAPHINENEFFIH